MLLFNIVGSSFSLCITFLLCYSGNRATHSLSGINATVYNSNWYQQPAKMQKYTNLIVQRSLKVAHMTGFKIFFCSLETFAKVKVILLLNFINCFTFLWNEYLFFILADQNGVQFLCHVPIDAAMSYTIATIYQTV